MGTQRVPQISGVAKWRSSSTGSNASLNAIRCSQAVGAAAAHACQTALYKSMRKASNFMGHAMLTNWTVPSPWAVPFLLSFGGEAKVRASQAACLCKDLLTLCLICTAIRCFLWNPDGESHAHQAPWEAIQPTQFAWCLPGAGRHTSLARSQMHCNLNSVCVDHGPQRLLPSCPQRHTAAHPGRALLTGSSQSLWGRGTWAKSD